MNELKIVNESEYTGEETSPAITFVNSEDGGRIVFAGNVAEYSKINNQEKSVEITESGVTEIVPDKGYTGLSKVSIDTSAISGGSNWKYFATLSEDVIEEFAMCPSLIKVADSNMGINILSPAGTFILSDWSLIAIAYDMNQAIYLQNPEGGTLTTVGDTIEVLLNEMGQGMNYLGAEITEEEFYHIPDLSHDGAHIQHIDGTLYTAAQWTAGGFSNDEANGIAVINEVANIHLVVAKDSLGTMPWSSKPNTLIDGVTTYTDHNDVVLHNTGAEDTAKIAAFDSDSAAAKCANYTFPNGQKGYLPSVADVKLLHSYEYKIRDIMNLIGGASFDEDFYWTSLQYSDGEAWYCRVGMEDQYHESKSNNYVCRPVCTLENYKFPTE